MTRYILENYDTLELQSCDSPSRKAAHEFGCALWPGKVVAVFSQAEYADREHYKAEYNQILYLLDGIDLALPDSKYTVIIRYLRNVQERISGLETYFTIRSNNGDD